MRYAVTIAGRSFAVELTGDRVVMDGREVTAALQPVPGTPLRHLVLPHASATFVMERRDGGWCVQSRGETFDVEVLDERTRALREMTGHRAAGGSGEVVKAPMPGMVLRVDVEPGQRVEPGAALLVLEAMKMENQITARGPGIVRGVHVEPGQAVERGVVLVEIGGEEA